ncbi:23S rRNA (adenine(1618)-N(6))-methyltransferase RlmF [Oceanospirillum maris]|uniref:23S rRNA (adenine(1618)-N(6))-methyltransferase RlmF n=1 Tax=Oceanospirillum maris TaxID=64977 RepID=UPI000412EB7B|nr:23S rRNA (adenine(1618)-N(6))-methyltransferase RlmF [Oceanospirillum maris]
MSESKPPKSSNVPNPWMKAKAMQKKKVTGLHPRNPHQGNDSHNKYDFHRLCQLVPELKEKLTTTPRGDTSIDFSDPVAVRDLNRGLLYQFYGIQYWDIPAGYLCPAVPGRADYIHNVADLLMASGQRREPPKGKKISVLDIGAGANCIYPIIGSRAYGWSFVAADSNAVAYNTAKQLVKMNRNLSGRIRCRKQLDEQHIFHGIIQKKEVFDLTICNPPFHASEEDAQAASQRKVDNLNKVDRDVDTDTPQSKATLNFGGQQPELWCEGGEMGFLNTMITESKDFAGQCLWFTSLVSRKEHIPELQQLLADAGVAQVKVLEMAQGNKISRIIAWSFLTSEEHLEWSEISWDAPLGQIRDAAELGDGGDEELDGDDKALDAEDLEQDDLEPNND